MVQFRSGMGYLYINHYQYKAIFVHQAKEKYRVRQEMLRHKHLEEINESKLQFFINISHEIRTPMSLIISPLQKLISTDNDSERQKSYSLIERNAQRILNLINQLMDIRKIDKNQMKLNFTEVDLISFINDIKTRLHIKQLLKELN